MVKQVLDGAGECFLLTSVDGGFCRQLGKECNFNYHEINNCSPNQGWSLGISADRS